MVRFENVSFSYSDKKLLEEVSFSIGENQKVALVGNNGAGKTTIFRLINGEELVTGGKIMKPKKIGFVPQEIKTDKKLSGGQKTKLWMQKVLLNDPDVLLLDEPTNFMDEKGKKWVHKIISSFSKTVIFTSHDIMLFNDLIDRVLYVNHQTKKIEDYKGNYTDFLKKKAEREKALEKEIKVKSRKIESLKESVKKLYKKTSKKRVRQRVMLERRLEREIENLPESPVEVRKIKLELPDPMSVGELPVWFKNISKSYEGKKVLNNVSFSLIRYQKLALIGKNGMGKSTLIKLILGQIKPDNGEIILPENLKVGYYSQEMENFNPNQTLFDFIQEKSKKGGEFIRPYLGRFNFVGNKVFQRIESLSGGEKTRLAIAGIMCQPFNLLILDEPTTYLDVMSVRIILDVLKSYRGTLIIVSHHFEFLNELKPDKAFLLPEEKLVYWDTELIKRVIEI